MCLRLKSVFAPLLQVSLPLRRDGTDGQAEVFWSLQPLGANRADVTDEDLQPVSGSVIFVSGQSDASINFTVLADDIPEVNETLLLTLDRYGYTGKQQTSRVFLFRKAYLEHLFILLEHYSYWVVCGLGLGSSVLMRTAALSLSLPLLPCRVETVRFIVYFG